MQRDYIKNITFEKLSKRKFYILLLMVCFVFQSFGITAKAADSVQKKSYIIKFLDAKNVGLLNSLGVNVKERFVGAKDRAFYNIYSFDSIYGIEDLQKYLFGNYEYLEPQRILFKSGMSVTDPGFSQNPSDVDKQWGLLKAGFPSAWEKTVGSKANVVAVIDTGVDETHEDLQSINFVPGFDFVAKQNILPGSNSDDNGHGTIVTGILGATVNNSRGIAGTNWEVSIMPLKSLDSSGKGDVTSVAEAIVWATDHGAQLVNLSIGGIGFGHDTALANAISYAFIRNVLLVAAAGNDVSTTGHSLDLDPVFPICDDNNFNMIIGVAATDVNDIKPDFSNYGKNCIDVTAPGKRILSTINFDPITKKLSPNSYAYASGTSLAVPYVVGQAALIRALYPFATNLQIRDRIISTADPVDNLNLTQCGGSSCRGLLGTGRINVLKSLETAIQKNYSEGDIIKIQDTGAVYEILGGQKRLISPFVLNQRFSQAEFKYMTSSQLAGVPDGPYVTPLDGTLVKFDESPAVYMISSGKKLPITYQVFVQKGLNFKDVNTLSFSELDSWVTGNLLPPQEGTLVKSSKNKTVYWVVGQALHPINYTFYVERGLNFFPIIVVSESDISNYPKGEAFIR